MLSSISQARSLTSGSLNLSNFMSNESTSKVKLLKYTTDYSPSRALGESAVKSDVSQISGSDLILFTYEDLRPPYTLEQLLSLKTSSYALGFTSSCRRFEFSLKVIGRSWSQFTTFATEHHKTKVTSKPGVLLSSLPAELSTCPIQYLILDNLTSSFREYAALFAFRGSPLIGDIIQMPTEFYLSQTPPPSPSLDTGGEEGTKEGEVPQVSGIGSSLFPILQKQYNPSQMTAIYSSVEANKRGLCLILGPPGTGKTTTILGIINTLHVKYFNRSYESAIAMVLGGEGMKCRVSSREDCRSWEYLSLLIKRPRILVLAPSNVGVDNIIERVLDKGFIDGNGGQYWPSMIRLGSGRGKRASKVRVVSLEESMEQILSIEKEKLREQLEQAQKDIKHLVQKIFNLQTLLVNMREAWHRVHSMVPEGVELRVNGSTAEVYFVDHRHQTTLNACPPADGSSTLYSFETLPEYGIYTAHLAPLLDQLRHICLHKKRLTLLRDPLSDRQQRQLIETSLIDDAHIVFTTLNSSGQGCLDDALFDVLVIDEAAQCTEPSLLIPLRLPCSKCLLVGDPLQLPATIFSTKSRHAGLDKSLFERLMGNGYAVQMLDHQYRMLPALSEFPSKMFYGGKLMNGANVMAPSYCPPYINNAPSSSSSSFSFLRFPPFVFFDLKASQDESKGSQSRYNRAEASFLIDTLKTFLLFCSKSGSLPSSIGIITPYQEQLAEVTRLLSKINWTSVFPSSSCPSDVPDIECNTVDSYQGREKDIVFVSCVRANDENAIGFLSDTRRMNVALTRAKHGLYIVGHAGTLRYNHMWSKLIEHAELRHSFIAVPVGEEGNIESKIRALNKSQHDTEAPVPIALQTNRLKNRLRTKRKNEEQEEGEVLETA